MNPTRGILFVFLFITSSLAQIQLQCVVKGSSRDVATAQLTIDGTNCGNGDCSLVKDKEFRYTLEFTPGIPNMRNVELSGTIFGLILHNNGHYGLKIISDNRKCTDFEKNKTDSNCSLEAKKAYKLSSQFKLDKEVQETGKEILLNFLLSLQEERSIDTDYAQCFGMVKNVHVA
ncbi:hypothetical protein Bhyg_15145 [Pseudolycoriella hygida]|uniref:Uncharacterized protein n=1 Tax=Pseudolycoriella hygida TaxID=35572 RepID=A0A9Q0MSX8_9DIPT|nr:hypothetical protein Bhyg_15145 [Pseudolycoriella hygida]